MFPTDKETFSQVSSSTSVKIDWHAARHNALSRIIEAIEDKIGIDNDTTPTTHEYKINNLSISKLDIDDFNTYFDNRLNNKTTDELTEWTTNRYYSTLLFNSDFDTKTTDDLRQWNNNRYYSTSLFNVDFGSKTTSDLREGSNLYYTDIRVNNNSHVSAWYNHSLINNSNPHNTKLSQLWDINISNLSNNDFLKWNGSAWINSQLPSGLVNYWTRTGTTLSPATSGDSISTSGNLYLTSLTSGSIPFIGSGGLLSQDNANFFWDNTNKRLGIGTSSPSSKLDIVGTGGSPSGTPSFPVRITSGSGTNSGFIFERTDASQFVSLFTGSSGAMLGFSSGLNRLAIGTYTYANRYSTGYPTTEVMSLLPNGNVGIGTTSPTDILSVKNPYTTLGVLYPIVSSQLAGSSTILAGMYGVPEGTKAGATGIAFQTFKENSGIGERVRINNAGNVGIGTTSPSYKLDVNGDINIATGSHYKINGTNLTYSDVGAVPTSRTVTINGTTYDLSADRSWTISAGFTDPMTTRGDIIYRNASNVTDRLPIGTSGKVLMSDGTDIGWSSSALGTAAYAATTAFEASGAVSTHAALQTGVHGISITAGKTLTVQKSITLTSADDTSVITLPTGTKTLLATDGSAANLTNFPTLNQDTTGKSAKTDALNSATTVINVSSATAPSAGQVLTATDSTHATWQTPSAGGITLQQAIFASQVFN